MCEPKFCITQTIEACADMINKPHEDYPKRVEMTGDSILLNFMASFALNYRIIDEELVKAIHHGVMWDMHPDYRSKYRPFDVIVAGNHVTPYLYVPRLMSHLHPFGITDRASLEYWYKEFEEIHPFGDGNGRVGGIVIAAFSWAVGIGGFLTPMQ